MKPAGPKYALLLESLKSKLTEKELKQGQQEIVELKMEFQRLIKKNKELDAKKIKAEQSETAAKEQFLRLTADFDNFRKRSLAEKTDIGNTEKADLVTQLLPLIDNFELASGQIKTTTEGEEKINNSYQGLYRQMIDIFRGFGVSGVDTVGTKFDPNFHEAVMRENNDEVEDGTILEEFRKGFIINDKLIRPAMVKVSFREEKQQIMEQEATSSGSDWESERETDSVDEQVEANVSGSDLESQPETNQEESVQQQSPQERSDKREGISS
eukprot:TRINITY_DN36799_c0_g1_i1.p1 TRINITY_DN36799_c0_g1~~TRINITY_DN36799_c0_g1_i1.p1  ORF type:complete len:269 (+),score=60.22 TRINITY_DN36799_c0_g1_i1:130-936(+)